MNKSTLLSILLFFVCSYSLAMEDNIDIAQQLYESLSQSDMQPSKINVPQKVNAPPKAISNPDSSTFNEPISFQMPEIKESKEITGDKPFEIPESVERERQFSITAGVKKILIFLTTPITAHPLLTTAICITGLIYAYKKQWLKQLPKLVETKQASQKNK